MLSPQRVISTIGNSAIMAPILGKELAPLIVGHICLPEWREGKLHNSNMEEKRLWFTMHFIKKIFVLCSLLHILFKVLKPNLSLCEDGETEFHRFTFLGLFTIVDLPYVT